jgi:5-methylthioribose kinase
MTTKSDFAARYPGVFYLDAGALDEIAAYLHRRGWLAGGEQVLEATKAGEGNMNRTLRVTTSARTFILKQARPWVEKYPHIAAPWDRIAVEAGFYELVASVAALAAMMPRRLWFDAASRLLALEDLGAAQDLTSVYRGDELAPLELEALAAYLRVLHRSFVDATSKPDFANRAMRELNHQHIFVVPLAAENGVDLDAITPGLESVAQSLRRDERLVREVGRLGSLYLRDGDALVHGDFFPGSWLRTARGVRVIDPEFCFFGPPEFDLGVMIAHLHVAGRGACISRLLAAYGAGVVEPRLTRQFAGIEIMRRLLGMAQLPIALGLGEKAALLAVARGLVLDG